MPAKSRIELRSSRRDSSSPTGKSNNSNHSFRRRCRNFGRFGTSTARTPRSVRGGQNYVKRGPSRMTSTNVWKDSDQRPDEGVEEDAVGTSREVQRGNGGPPLGRIMAFA